MATDIKKYNFKEGLPLEFEIADMRTLYQSSKEQLTRPHRTGFYHVLWFRKGSPAHLVDFNLVKIKPGSLLFLNKDTVQRFDPRGNFDGTVILFTDAFFCRTENDIKFLRKSILFNDLYPVSLVRPGKQTASFLNLLELMTTELEKERDSYQSDILQNLLHNFLLLSERKKHKLHPAGLKKSADLDYTILFKELLESGFRLYKQVSKYAQQLSITEKRLNQATSKVLGRSPKEMIDERIMLEAKRLLAHTTESVKEIGYELGFDEPTNFIKFFRKHHHSTPVEFRAQFSR